MDSNLDKKINKRNKIKIRNSNGGNKKVNFGWVIKIIIWTFCLSVSLSFISSTMMEHVNLSIAFVILLVFILLGVTFDIIGIAVTAATETPFHSMASRKIAGAKQAIVLIRNAEKVSNFCNDVIGDITGIISGTTSAIIITHLVVMYKNINDVIAGIIMTGIVAAVTVGGKAVGKTFAISQSNFIVYQVGLLVHYLHLMKNKKTDTNK